MLPREVRCKPSRNGFHLHAKDAIKQIRHDCETSCEFHQWINPDFKPVKDWKEGKQWEKVKAFGCTTMLLQDPAFYDMVFRNISFGLNYIRKPEYLRNVCMVESTESFSTEVIEEAVKRMEVIYEILQKATRGFLSPSSLLQMEDKSMTRRKAKRLKRFVLYGESTRV